MRHIRRMPKTRKPPLPELEDLGPALALLRDRKDLTQAEVARRAGLGKSQLSKYEAGKEVPTLPSLVRLLRVLGVGLAEFWYTVHVLKELPPSPGQPVELLPRGLLPQLDDSFAEVLKAVFRLHREAVTQMIERQAAERKG